MPDRTDLSTQNVSDPAGQDLLLDCLEFAAQKLGSGFSRRGAVTGLPLVESRLTRDLLPRAAARQGFLCEVRRIAIPRIPLLSLPAILLLKSESACVLVSAQKKKTYAVYVPERGEIETWNYGVLKERYAGHTAFVAAAEAGELGAGRNSPAWFTKALSSGWTTWLQILLTAFLVNLLGLALPLFTMNVYDRVIPNMAFPTLWALAIGVFLALLIDSALRQFRAILLDSTGRRIDLRVSADIFEHAMATSLGAQKASSGAVASQIREFDAVREFFTSSSIIAITDLLFIALSLWVLWLLAGEIAFIPLLAVPLVIGVTLLLQIPLSRFSRITQNHASRRHSVLVESLVGIESIKAANAEGVVQRKWEDALAATARANSSSRKWSSFALYFTSVVQQAVSILIIVWGVVLIYQGNLSIGALIAASLLSSRILSPLGNIAMTLARGQQAISALRGIGSLMQLPRDGPAGRFAGPTVLSACVEFRKVTFNYPGQQRAALSNISFKISAGERVGIIGKVGSGKTTIGRLLAGLYTASQGTVLVSDADTRAFDPAELRAGVGFVSQDPELFTGTLRDNIVMGRPGASQEAVNAVVKEAGLAELIASHPSGMLMEIGERGKSLSGGQRQAVAIARILLRDTKILFLDEPSSALDSVSELSLVKQLTNWSEAPGRTLIICSHRSAMLNAADRLLVINDGALIADGPKADVLDKLGAATGRVTAPPVAQETRS